MFPYPFFGSSSGFPGYFRLFSRRTSEEPPKSVRRNTEPNNKESRSTLKELPKDFRKPFDEPRNPIQKETRTNPPMAEGISQKDAGGRQVESKIVRS
jgi:hypothetical protein